MVLLLVLTVLLKSCNNLYELFRNIYFYLNLNLPDLLKIVEHPLQQK